MAIGISLLHDAERAAAEILHLAFDIQAGFQRFGVARPAGHHQPAWLERVLRLCGEARRGDERAQWTAEYRRRRSDEDRRAVERHNDAEVRKVYVRLIPRPDHEWRRRRIVRNDVGQRE